MCKVIKSADQSQALRQTFSQFPTGVAVVTAYSKFGHPVGMTINSFSSASLTPPLVTWCIDKNANSYSDFAQCKFFTITILAENQKEIAQQFARKGADKFKSIACDSKIKPPVIPHGSAELYCEHERSVFVGDHLLLVGLVTQFVHNKQAPLVFAQGSFQQLQQAEAVNA